ncbi:MAG: YcnI family protein [Alphaproteobacteria bacterium]
MKSFLPFMAVVLFAPLASAHVVADPNTGKANSYFKTSFRISHGCDGSATVLVRIKMPADITSVHPQNKPGWTAKIIHHKDKTVPSHHGNGVQKVVDEVIWTGGPLPPDQYDEFGLVMKLPNTPDETLWFPITQQCRKGMSHWVEIPSKGQAWGAMKSPAPFVRITKAAE